MRDSYGGSTEGDSTEGWVARSKGGGRGGKGKGKSGKGSGGGRPPGIGKIGGSTKPTSQRTTTPR